MKQKLFVLLAALIALTIALTACQTGGKNEGENDQKIASYSGYSNIPDFGDVSGKEADAKLGEAAAARLGVDPETVKVYPVDENSAAFIETWEQELKTRGFTKSADMEAGGNTVTWYSDDRKIGVVTGYMDTDLRDSVDALAVMLVDKASAEQYVNIDYETAQESWSNANNGGSFYIDDKKIYGYGFVGNAAEGFLSKNTDSSSAIMLVEDESPKFVQEVDKTVYAYLPGRIVAVDTKEKDPEVAVTTLIDTKAESLQYYNERLYYTNSDGLFYSEPDGTEAVNVTGKVMKKAWLLGDKVYYKDPEDNGTEHVYSLLTGADTRVTEETVYSFFLGSKNYGYYIAKRDVPVKAEDEETADEETATEAAEEAGEDTAEEATEAAAESEETETVWMLIRVSLKDGELTELTTVREGTSLVGINGKVYYVSDEHEGQIYCISKSGGTAKRVTRDKDCRKLMTFHDMLLYYDYDDETEDGLEHIYISTTDGFMKSDILY